MEIGHLGGFKAHKRKVAANIQVYIQLLEGKMVVNDITLEPGVGLCLSSMKSLNIIPTQESKFILLYHHS